MAIGLETSPRSLISIFPAPVEKQIWLVKSTRCHHGPEWPPLGPSSSQRWEGKSRLNEYRPCPSLIQDVFIGFHCCFLTLCWSPHSFVQFVDCSTASRFFQDTHIHLFVLDSCLLYSVQVESETPSRPQIQVNTDTILYLPNQEHIQIFTHHVFFHLIRIRFTRVHDCFLCIRWHPSTEICSRTMGRATRWGNRGVGRQSLISVSRRSFRNSKSISSRHCQHCTSSHLDS